MLPAGSSAQKNSSNRKELIFKVQGHYLITEEKLDYFPGKHSNTFLQ